MKPARAAARAGGVAAVAALVLSGCATTTDLAKEGLGVDWAMRRDSLGRLDGWRLEGRIALSAGNDGWNGTLSWEQREEDLDFRFRGPLGIGGFRIHSDGDLLRLKTTSGDVLYLSDPEAELQAEFGWSIPVYSMRYWMLGIPDPAEEAYETVDGGRLVHLEQLGWSVRYDAYRSFGGSVMPRKLVMEGGDVRIRVAVDRWSLDD